MSEREKVIREAVKILLDFWEKEYKEAGSPVSWCPDEELRFTIDHLKVLVGDEQ